MDEQAPAGVTGHAIQASSKLLQTLPPAFLLLLAINVIFVGGVLWFLNSQMAQRTALFGRVLDACVEVETHPR